MSKDHAPDGKTQVVLAQLRWIARRYDIQRRSANKQFYNEAEAFLTEQTRRTIDTLYPSAAQHISNAHMLTQDMMVKIDATKKTLEQVSKFWAQVYENPDKKAQSLYNDWMEKYKTHIKDLENEPCYWSRLQGLATSKVYDAKNQVQDVNADLYVDPISDDMDQKQKDRVKKEAYITRNNSISTLVASQIRLEAIEAVVQEIKTYWAQQSQTNMEKINEAFDKSTKEQTALLLENEQYLQKLDDYLFRQFNYRQPVASPVYSTQSTKPSP